jgi:hypothetical protein
MFDEQPVTIERKDKRCTFRGGPLNNRKIHVEDMNATVRAHSKPKIKPYWGSSLSPTVLEPWLPKTFTYLRVKMARTYLGLQGEWVQEFWWEFWEQKYHDKRKRKEAKHGVKT